MRIDEARQQEYYELLCELMMYANERLGIVRDFDVFEPSWPIEIELEEKCLIILQELWRTPDIIEDFARDSSYRLSASKLSLVRSWTDALPGIYIVLHVEDGAALVMGKDHLFEVSGFGSTLELGFPVLPVCIEGALLPYGDVIVMQEPMRVYGLPPVSDEDVATHVASLPGPPVSSGPAFRLAARAAKKRALKDKMDYLLNGADREDRPCEGFHRGALYGMTEDERELCVRRELEALLGPAQMGELCSRAEPEDPIAEEALKAASVLESCAFIYGAIGLKRAYRLYKDMASGTLGLDAFTKIAAGGDRALCDTGIISRNGEECVVNHVLSVSCMIRDAIRDVRDEGLNSLLADLESRGADSMECCAALQDALRRRSAGDDLPRRIKSLYEQFECQTYEYIDRILESHRQAELRPLAPELLRDGWVDYMCGSPEAVALRRFLDGTVPDGENDYLFADCAVEDFVRAISSTGSLGSSLRMLKQYGYPHGEPSTVKFIRLLINLYKAFPTWDDNGWSIRERTERLTGRRVFYGRDGNELKLAEDDPCPCGSGATYGECCGDVRSYALRGL